MADYLLFSIDGDPEHTILTPNREVTINRRETSYEGLAGKLENGEDGIYNMISSLGKGALLGTSTKISEQDIEEVPNLKELRQEIVKVEEQLKDSGPQNKYLLRRQLIQMRQDQYILRNEYRCKNTYSPSIVDMSKEHKHIILDFDSENVTVNEETEEIINNDRRAISLFNAHHISCILQFYEKLKIENEEDSSSLLVELDALIDKTLKDKPIWKAILHCKIAGFTNLEIQEVIKKEFGITHSLEHISDVWRNKIPQALAEERQKEYLVWYYTYKNLDPTKWKVCTRCGQKKLISPKFFSRNCASGDGFYSICKDCRRKINIERKVKKDANNIRLANANKKMP